MTELYSLGLGVGTQNSNGDWLEVFYPAPLLAPDAATATAIAEFTGYSGGNQAITLDANECNTLADALQIAGNSEQAAIASRFFHSKRPLVVTLLASDEAPSSVPE